MRPSAPRPLGLGRQLRYHWGMAREVVAKVISVAFDDDMDGHVVHFWVGQELADEPSLNEALSLIGSMDSLQRETFAMIIREEDNEYTMEPDEDLAECLIIFDAHNSADELEQPLSRQWKTGQMAEALTTHLVNSNLFGVWRTGEDTERNDEAVEVSEPAPTEAEDSASEPSPPRNREEA